MLSFIPDFLITRLFRKRKGCFIDVLSNDILVDHIFIYFSVEDILSIRRVSKLYYYLTHQPIIWKRLLRHINIPLPPLPPTPRYALGELDFEAERLVFRAISLDDNWRSFNPKLYSCQRLKAFNEVLAMTVLPGGKYLVASVRDSGCNRYTIMVFVLDHATRGSVALAKTPTKCKAYNLQAKYMTYQGVQGIAISYIRRKFKGNKRCGINPSDYSHMTEIDPPMPLQYECVCLHISLQSLELLGDPKILGEFHAHAANQPPPFREMARIRSSTPLDFVNLVESDGMPFVVVVKRPDEVVIKDLTSRVISTMKCEPYEPLSDLPHTIRGLGVFPDQNQILIIRSVPPTLPLPQATPMYLIEIYNTPIRGETMILGATDRYIIDNRHIASFLISDHNLATKHDKSIQPSLPAAHGPPSPISIFCRTTKPHGLQHYMVWPTHVNLPPLPGSHMLRKFYYYSLDRVSFQSRHDCDPNIAHVLPGAYRTLIYTVPSDDRTDSPSLLNLRRYITPEVQPFDYPLPDPENLSEEQRVMKKRKLIPSNIYSSLSIPKKLATSLKEDGVTAVAWDEGIGRVCIAASYDSVIHILDFAQTPKRL